MPQLITNITANVLDNFIGTVTIFTPISAQIQQEDYINLNGFIAYLQNFSRIELTEPLEKPLVFGLKNAYNVSATTLNISY